MALLHLLALERRALLAGNFDALPELALRKHACLGPYEAHPEQLRRAPALLAALRHNQRLLEHAMQGLAAVGSRLGDWQALTQRMDTYGPNGRKTGIGQGPVGKIHRKL
ncbi:hypothetical protein [Salipiger mangrovisoli]|uniref:FlgN protein n=1 Tax=Salipiger mangrovisoli TaxID=2865933 RepID=A0ABR9WX81_9RHOB|nr:hypothetical protein [Salipiger mangrovisoli]MBE9635898.1 hypothetical protein [Salipiger mangrovisoli]